MGALVSCQGSQDLQMFVNSWQRESAAIKKQKSQQSFLRGARN